MINGVSFLMRCFLLRS